MQLRQYQIEAIARLRTALSQGAKRVLLVSPTGSGKTVTLAEIVRRSVERGRRALWTAHRAELVEQSCETLNAFGLTVGAMCAGASIPPNPYAPVQVASVQTLLARKQRPAADILILDEAHHYCASAPEFASLLALYPEAIVIGATATPERGDGCGLRGSFDALVVAATVQQLTDDGYLVPCRVMRPDKPLQPGELAQNPVDAYVEHAMGRRAIVFCKSVMLAEQYAGEFVMHGISARTVSAETPWAERRMILDAFKRGAIQVLVNVYVLTEGFDDPAVSCCIIARGCGSAGMYLQMAGRILRPASGKSDAVLLDLRGVSHEHGRPEDPREYSLDGRGIRLRDPNSYCPVCGAPRTPPEPCSACGYCATGEDAAKGDRVLGIKLVPYAHLRSDDDATRARRLARWIQQSRAKGYRDGFWKAKFRAVYEAYPSAALIEMAMATLRGGQEKVA